MAEPKKPGSVFFERAKQKASSIAGDKEKISDLLTDSKEKLHNLSFENSKISKLGTNLRTILRMVQAYANGSYRELPWKTLLAFLGGIIYFLMPVDLVPDFIPFTGLLDDFTVIMFITGAFQQDIEQFLEWEATKK